MIELKNRNKTIHLRDILLWDVDLESLDANTSKKLIVERILTRGNIEEFKQLIRFYSSNELCQTVIKIGYLDEPTLNFISQYLKLPKQDFLCYRKKLSNPVHCSF